MFQPILGLGDEYGIHNSNVTNMLTSVLERCLLVEGCGELVPRPNAVLDPSKEWKKFRSKLRLPTCSPEPRETTHLLWSGPKREFYRRIGEQVMCKSVTRADAVIRQFIKVEKVAGARRGPKSKRKAPRNISPRNPRYNFELARYLKRLEHSIYNSTAKNVRGESHL